MSIEASPCERLAASRERLRQALQQVNQDDSADGPTQGLLGGLLSHFQDVPGGGLVAGLLKAWWQKQPLRLAWLLAAQTATALLQPVARRHPYALVLTATVAGGLLVLARPWRWLLPRTLLAGLLPQMLSVVMKHFAPPSGAGTPKPPDHAPQPRA